MLTITYRQQPYILHTQNRFNNHTVHSLYRIVITATSLVGMMKMGNIVARVGIKPTSLALCVSVLIIIPPRLPDITILPTSTCLWDTREVSAHYYSSASLWTTSCLSKCWSIYVPAPTHTSTNTHSCHWYMLQYQQIKDPPGPQGGWRTTLYLKKWRKCE